MGAPVYIYLLVGLVAYIAWILVRLHKQVQTLQRIVQLTNHRITSIRY